MKQYYIISLKHTSKGDTALTFWCANGAGYSWHRDRAGLYPEDKVDAYTSEDNVKVEKEKVDPFWMNAVDYGDKYISVANTPAVRNAIGITDRLMKPKKYAGCRMAFMNTPVLTIILYFLILLTACNGSLDSHHEVRYSPDGKDSVVYLMYFDGQQFNNVYMNCQQFKVLYDDGGYESVYDYYLGHKLPEHWLTKYKAFKPR